MKELPKFKRGEFDKKLDKYEEKKVLQDFDKFCQISAGATKVKDMLRNVFKFLLIVNKPTKKINLQDLRSYLVILKNSEVSGLTKNDMRVHVQKFLRWKFKDWSERFDEFRDIKNAIESKPKKNREAKDIVRGFKKPHAEIVKELIDSENKLFWRLFIVMNYEQGMRTGEIRTFERDWLKKRKGRFECVLKMSKNKKEKPLVFSQRFSKLLEMFENEKKNKGIESKYIFPSPKDPTKPISKGSVNVWFGRLSEKVLGKKLFPYILRHMHGTDLDKLQREGKISLTNAAQTMGHTEKVFKSTYSHTSEEVILDLLAEQLYGDNLTVEESNRIVVLEKEIKELKKSREIENRNAEHMFELQKKMVEITISLEEDTEKKRLMIEARDKTKELINGKFKG